jgi:hypothetical protein
VCSPIREGESKDATNAQIMQMRKRTHVLYTKLNAVVHRKDLTTLAADLPAKREFVLSLKMTHYQSFLYRSFLIKIGQRLQEKTGRKNLLFLAYQNLLRIWNHPACMMYKFIEDGRGNKSYKRSTTLSQICRDLSYSHQYFVENGRKIGTMLEKEATKVESHMLRNEQGGGANNNSSSSSSSSSNAMSRMEAIEISDDEDENDADLEGFVVPDDAPVEYFGSEDGNSDESKDLTLDKEKASSDSRKRKGQNSRPTKTSSTDKKRLKKLKKSSDESGDDDRMLEESSEEDNDDANDEDYVDNDGASNISSDAGSSSGGSVSFLFDLPPDSKDRNSRAINRSATPSSAKSEAVSVTASAAAGDDDLFDLATLGRDHPNPTKLKTTDFLALGNKLVAFLSLLVLSVKCNDKVLLFSQSLPTLDVIELILKSPDWGKLVDSEDGDSEEDEDEEENFDRSNQFSKWRPSQQYMRIDGSISERQSLIDGFNKSDQCKLFLISTRAGNMGINLYTANRVIVFDSSWNPANDLQAVYRAYRYGQKKPVFVYRLLAAGTMEEKIYKRQVQKLALANRVVDQQMPDNQFSEAEKTELLAFNDDDEDSENIEKRALLIERAQAVLSTGTKDDVLIQFLHTRDHVISSLEDQGELLRDNEDAHLTKEEREQAEEDYEFELKGGNSLHMRQQQQMWETMNILHQQAAAAGVHDGSGWGLPSPNMGHSGYGPYHTSANAVLAGLTSGITGASAFQPLHHSSGLPHGMIPVAYQQFPGVAPPHSRPTQHASNIPQQIVMKPGRQQAAVVPQARALHPDAPIYQQWQQQQQQQQQYMDMPAQTLQPYGTQPYGNHYQHLRPVPGANIPYGSSNAAHPSTLPASMALSSIPTLPPHRNFQQR